MDEALHISAVIRSGSILLKSRNLGVGSDIGLRMRRLNLGDARGRTLRMKISSVGGSVEFATLRICVNGDQHGALGKTPVD